jgi:carboxyl-terminal processing protease
VGERTFGKGLVQTIMPLHNVRGYALALTTARYYTPSGRLIQRDYSATALEDYVAPRDRKPCVDSQGEAKLTDAGRKVYGGDGITPDYCVDPETPSKLVSYLIQRQAFVNFSRQFAAAGSIGSAREIAGTGSRSGVVSTKVRVVESDFKVDEKLLADFAAYLAEKKLRATPEDLATHKEEITRRLTEEVTRQVFGEGEARRRTAQWDPQIQKALEVAPRAALLLKNPEEFIALREAEGRIAASGSAATPATP